MLEISFGVLAILILLGVPIAFALMASTIIFFVATTTSPWWGSPTEPWSGPRTSS